jgi:hypothetical protein
MNRWLQSTPALVALIVAACTPPLEEVTTSAGPDSSGSGSGSTTMTTPGTTLPGESTLGTMGGTGMETTMGNVDTTADASTSETTMSVDPTMGSSGESSSTGPLDCMPECPNNQICDNGVCVAACAWAAGTYGSCLNALGGVDALNVCGANHICLNDPYPYSLTTCSLQTCVDACECPAPPATGDAIVTCANITSPGMTNDCYLSCANGEMCPDGMMCLNDDGGSPLLCATPVPSDVPMYGNCDDLVTTCDGGTCGVFGSSSVCTEGCGNAGDCEAAPAGAMMGVDCDDVFNPPGGNDCYLPCFNGGDCPVGMGCDDVSGPGGACMW